MRRGWAGLGGGTVDYWPAARIRGWPRERAGWVRWLLNTAIWKQSVDGGVGDAMVALARAASAGKSLFHPSHVPGTDISYLYHNPMCIRRPSISPDKVVRSRLSKEKLVTSPFVRVRLGSCASHARDPPSIVSHLANTALLLHHHHHHNTYSLTFAFLSCFSISVHT